MVNKKMDKVIVSGAVVSAVAAASTFAMSSCL